MAIELITLSSGDEATATTLTIAVRYPDGTFDVIAIVNEARCNTKHVRVFEAEPGNHHVTRASHWVESGCRSSTVPGRA